MATLPDTGPLLPPCPASPNCVSSLANDSHFIEPFPITGDGKKALSRLKKVLRERSDTTIVTDDDRAVRVEFRTTLGFVDDALFILGEEGKVIHVRSASRLGYWDFGKNRRRLEEIRKEYLKQ